MRKHVMSHAWAQWALLMRAAVRRDRSTLAAQTSEMQALLLAAGAVPLDELHGEIRALEEQRREERGRLEAEVLALSDALRSKREQCEQLRRANARVLAQFEYAESEFLEAERARETAAPTTVVGRLVEAVFGAEPPPAHTETVRTLVSYDGRGDPADRLAIAAAGSTHHHHHHHHRDRGSPPARARSRGVARPSSQRPAPARRGASTRAVAKPTAKSFPQQQPTSTPHATPPPAKEAKHPGGAEHAVTAEQAIWAAESADARALVARARARADRELIGYRGPPYGLESDTESAVTGGR